MLGAHLIKAWSSTQPNQALSSAEAEYYGVVKASSMGLGYQSLARDLSVKLPLRVWTDSTAAMGVIARQGVGKIRHLDTRTLWVQQAARTGSIEYRKVLGTENPADLFTKHLPTAEKLNQLIGLFGCEVRGGRAEAAPQMRRERLTQQTLGDTGNVNEECVYPVRLPHCGNITDEEFPLLIPPEMIPEDVEEADNLQLDGEVIAEAIVEQSLTHGRRREFDE